MGKYDEFGQVCSPDTPESQIEKTPNDLTEILKSEETYVHMRENQERRFIPGQSPYGQ